MPRNYSTKTIKRLFALSGNMCAYPGCDRTLVNKENALESNICHIEAAREGGERFNPKMIDKERADYNNLILLCVQHHDITNNVGIYTVERLKKMKREHEAKFLHVKMTKNPSMLNNIINAISEIEFDNITTEQSLESFDPRDKLDYNRVMKNRGLIEEYKVYYDRINSLYEELEIQGSLKKERLLNTIKGIYVKIKGEFVLDAENPIDIIRENSDSIFDKVIDELCMKLKNSGLFEEDIHLGVNIILVDAFIRCKILEKPI